MPPAQTAHKWEIEPVELKAWPETKNRPASWREHRTEGPSNFRIVGGLDIYKGLKAEIEQAKRILELEDDWDGEGSLGYSEDTFNRAITFLTTHVERLWDTYSIPLPIPRIGPGPDGSIDLHWKQPSWELLVNIPADANEMATFYGDNYAAQKFRGSLDPKNFNLGIATWLMN